MEFLRKNFTLAIFTIFVFGTGLIVYSQGDALWPRYGTLRWDVAGVMGQAAIAALILVYLRLVLKIIIQRGNLWQRLQPLDPADFDVRTILQRALYYLNLFHPYLGVIAIAAILMHSYLMINFQGNLALRIVLYLILWQGFWGFVLTFKYTPTALKRQGLKLHSQFITGILILVLALIGHQLSD